MRYVFLIIGFLLVINLSAQPDKRLIELSGTISDKYPIKMILTIKNDKILGYYYEKYKTKILLSGQIKGTKVTLNESPDYESEFKIGFIGDLNGKMFIGKWIEKNKSKSLDFKCFIDSVKELIIDNKIVKIEGYYKDIFNSEKFQGSVILHHINETIFSFEISNGSENCVGYLQGLIDLKNLKTGLYSADLCKELRFDLESDTLIIKEKECDWHGAYCPFDGKYQKK